MHRPLFTLFVAFSVACTSSSHDPTTTVLPVLPRLGSEFASSTVADTALGKHVYVVVVDKSSFAVAVSASTRRVVSVSTRDASYQSPEGVHIGTPVSSLPRVGGQWHSEPGAGCVFILPSGWRALIPSAAPGPDSNRDTPAERALAPAPDLTIEAVPTPSCPPAGGSVTQLTLESDPGA